MTVFLSDLKMSMQMNMPIRLATFTREYLGAVRDVNEEAEYIVLHTPRTFGDKTTATTIPMAEIVSVSMPG